MVDERFAGAMLLMEVMPTILARRHFPPPATAETLEPGFRDSPDPAAGMALVFTRVRLPCLAICCPPCPDAYHSKRSCCIRDGVKGTTGVGTGCPAP